MERAPEKKQLMNKDVEEKAAHEERKRQKENGYLENT